MCQQLGDQPPRTALYGREGVGYRVAQCGHQPRGDHAIYVSRSFSPACISVRAKRSEVRELKFTFSISSAFDRRSPNIEYWSPASIYLEYQNATTAWKLSGANITLQSLTRKGGIDGSGQTWWDAYAVEKARGGRGVAGGSSRLFARPIPLAVADAYDVRVDGKH
jgi:hypothetical protein